MNKLDTPTDPDIWFAEDPNAVPVPGYDEWLKAEIAEGIRQIEAGQVTPLAQVRKEFGLE